MTSETTPNGETDQIVAVHDLPGQRHGRFTVTCVAPLSAYAAIVLPEARRIVADGRGLAVLPSTAISTVHVPSCALT